MRFKSEILYYVFLLLVAVAGFWQIASGQYTLKYDMIDCSYPWRFMIGEHIQNGMLPLWNPYQSLGYPLFADLQSGSSWYLPVWIIGGLFGYNIYTLSFEFIFHIFMAGAGMFFLARVIGLHARTAFVLAISYMLSGFFVGNAQHFTLIVGATWFPFVLGAYWQMMRTPNIKTALKTAFFIFLFMGGGYATYLVSAFYILIILFITYTILLAKKKDKLLLKRFIKFNLVLVAAVLLLSSVIIFSAIDIYPELMRTQGLAQGDAMLNPFSPQSLLSCILPYAVIKNMSYFNTDLSMSNAYFGILIFVFFTVSLFIQKNKTYFFFLFMSLFSLLVAMGDYLPLRKMLYDYVPLMNMFRFPAVFRLFFITGTIICAGFAIDIFFRNTEAFKKHILWINGVLIAIFLGLIIYARACGYLEMKLFFNNGLFAESENATFTQHLVFQSAIQIIVLFSFSLIIFFRKRISSALILLIVAELVFAAQLNAPYTVFYPQIKQKDVMQHHNDNFISGFPVQEHVSINENTNAKLAYGPFWRNLTNFHKQVSSEGFTSLALRNINNFRNAHETIFDLSVQNPIAYTTTKIKPFDEIFLYKDTNAPSELIFIENKKIDIIKKVAQTEAREDDISVLEFLPHRVVLNTKSEGDRMLVFMQNHYKGWHAYIDNTEAEIIKVNGFLMGLHLPGGAHEVVFIFKKPLIVAGALISLISLMVCGFIFLLYFYRAVLKGSF